MNLDIFQLHEEIPFFFFSLLISLDSLIFK
jgi:hypothetical protein